MVWFDDVMSYLNIEFESNWNLYLSTSKFSSFNTVSK